MKPISKIIFLICLFSLSISARADAILNGIAVHSELGQDSFIGALFTSTLSTNSRDILISQEEKQLQVRVLAKRISARRFKRMWIEGLAINASSSELQEQSKNMAAFSNMLKVSLRKGDIFAVQRSNTAVKIIINGSTLGEIDDVAFFDLLLRTWIGPVPLSSQFREDLLKGGEFSLTLQQLFNETRPSDERIKAVATALLEVEKRSQPEQAPKPQVVAVPSVPSPQFAPPTLLTPPSIPNAPSAPEIPQPSIPADEGESVQPTPAQAPQLAESETADPTNTDQEKTTSNQEESELAGQNSPDASIGAETEAIDDNESIIEEDQEDFTAETLLVQQLYLAELKKWTYKKLLYPQVSLERSEQGVVRLEVTINRDGKVLDTTTIEAPSHKRLTKAALKAVKKSSPYPKIPESIKDETFTFTLPILFKIVEE